MNKEQKKALVMFLFIFGGVLVLIPLYDNLLSDLSNLSLEYFIDAIRDLKFLLGAILIFIAIFVIKGNKTDSNYAPPSTKETSDMDSIPQSQKVSPWRRYWARFIDLSLFSFLLGLLATFYYPSFFWLNEFVLGILLIFLWIFMETILLACLGTTPGKWLLNIRVVDLADKKPSLKASFKRSFNVWWEGLGSGIPIISMVTLIASYNKLKNTGITNWDRALQFRIKYKKLGFLRIALATILIISMLGYSSYERSKRRESGLDSSLHSKIPVSSLNSYETLSNWASWNRVFPGVSGLSLLSPETLNETKMNYPESTMNLLAKLECFEYKNNDFSIMTQYLEGNDQAQFSLDRAVIGSTEEMKKTIGVINYEYSQNLIQISGIAGKLAFGSFNQYSIGWKFKEAILLDGINMWQIILIYKDKEFLENAADVVINSIIINRNKSDPIP